MTPINEHDMKLIQAAAEVVTWGADDDLDSDPQAEMLGHNPAVIDQLSDQVIIDLLGAVSASDAFGDELEDLTSQQMVRLKALASTAFIVGVYAAEVAYKDHLQEDKGE